MLYERFTLNQRQLTMYVHICFVAEGKQLIDETVQSFNDVKVLKLRMSGWMISLMDGWIEGCM